MWLFFLISSPSYTQKRFYPPFCCCWCPYIVAKATSLLPRHHDPAILENKCPLSRLIAPEPLLCYSWACWGVSASTFHATLQLPFNQSLNVSTALILIHCIVRHKRGRIPSALHDDRLRAPPLSVAVMKRHKHVYFLTRSYIITHRLDLLKYRGP